MNAEPLLEEGRAGQVNGGGGGGNGGGFGALPFCGLLCLLGIPFAWLNLCAVIPPNHVGIRYNSFSKVVDYSDFWWPGRHFAGPVVSFILFPTSVQNSHLDLVSRTSEGYPLKLKMSFQYQIIAQEVLELYREYNVKYDMVIVRNARDAMMKAVSQYTATDFFLRRGKILDDMHKLLQDRLRKSHVNCWWVQFDDVSQSESFEANLLRTQLQEWFVQTKEAQQQVSAIQAKTSVLKAEFDKNISIVNSTATADCAYLLSQADAKASVFLRESEANATLIVDRAEAKSTRIIRQAKAAAELKYQSAAAEGNQMKMTEEANANNRTVALDGLRLKYWKEMIGLSDAGLVQLQRVVGNSYKKLEDVSFLFGFENSYATADGNGHVLASKPPALAQAVELAAVGGSAAGAAAEQAAEAVKAETVHSSHTAVALQAVAANHARADAEADNVKEENDAIILPSNWEHTPETHPEF